MYEAFVDLVLKNENKKFMIISHYNPDGDTVGSALAMYEALTNIGKEVDVFCSSDFNSKLKFIPHFDRYNKKTLKSYDVAIAVDCADDKRLGDYASDNPNLIFDTASGIVTSIKRYIQNKKLGQSFVETLNIKVDKGSKGDLVISHSSEFKPKKLLYRTGRAFGDFLTQKKF